MLTWSPRLLWLPRCTGNTLMRYQAQLTELHYSNPEFKFHQRIRYQSVASPLWVIITSIDRSASEYEAEIRSLTRFTKMSFESENRLRYHLIMNRCKYQGYWQRVHYGWTDEVKKDGWGWKTVRAREREIWSTRHSSLVTEIDAVESIFLTMWNSLQSSNSCKAVDGHRWDQSLGRMIGLSIKALDSNENQSARQREETEWEVICLG